VRQLPLFVVPAYKGFHVQPCANNNNPTRIPWRTSNGPYSTTLQVLVAAFYLILFPTNMVAAC